MVQSIYKTMEVVIETKTAIIIKQTFTYILFHIKIKTYLTLNSLITQLKWDLMQKKLH